MANELDASDRWRQSTLNGGSPSAAPAVTPDELQVAEIANGTADEAAAQMYAIAERAALAAKTGKGSSGSRAAASVTHTPIVVRGRQVRGRLTGQGQGNKFRSEGDAATPALQALRLELVEARQAAAAERTARLEALREKEEVQAELLAQKKSAAQRELTIKTSLRAELAEAKAALEAASQEAGRHKIASAGYDTLMTRLERDLSAARQEADTLKAEVAELTGALVQAKLEQAQLQSDRSSGAGAGKAPWQF